MFLGIVVSTLGLLSCSSHFSLWAFLVLSTLFSIGYFKNFLPSCLLVLLFVTSVLGGLLFLLGSLLSSSFCLLSDLGLLLKLGFSPFHFWIVKVVNFLRNFSSFILLGFMKLGPLFLLLDRSSLINIWGLASFLIGLPILWSVSSVNLLLLGSGLLQFWILSFLNSCSLFFYFFSYLIRLFFCCCAHFLKLSFSLACLSLAGLPPFPFFVAKLSVLSVSPNILSLLILLVSALSLVPYSQFGFSCHSNSSTSPLTLLFLLLTSLLSLCFSLPSF